jgi:hypothetical protein
MPTKARLTLLQEGNCAGEFKLKPSLDYHSAKPRTAKDFVNAEPPMVCTSHLKVWVSRLYCKNASAKISVHFSKEAALNQSTDPGHQTILMS